MSESKRRSRSLPLSWIEARQHFRSPRFFALIALLMLFICGGSWGLADPNSQVTGQLSMESNYEVLFLVSLFVLFSSTLGVVLLGFDGISRKRLTGELAIELAQPISRNKLAMHQAGGLLIAVSVPTTVALLIGVMLIDIQLDTSLSFADFAYFFVATLLVIMWYVFIQLLVSSIAKDLGTSVTLGIGVWMLFTLIWLLVTAVLAAFMGVDVTDVNSTSYDRFSEMVDLFSPNGVYQLLLEDNLEGDSKPQLMSVIIWFAAMMWSIFPATLFLSRMKRLKP